MTMNIIPNDDLALASAWIELQHIPVETSNYDALASAAVNLNNLCLTDEDRAWNVVKAVFESSSDEWVIENLGAGPVESLLDFHPSVTIKKIEHYVAERPDFKKVLAHVWTSRLSTEHQQALSKSMRQGRSE
ncbi:DUF6869 domain-containing protein [Xanthomonas campestris pv. fici]|uniref:DUF6869 domain-containing protein n=1 Tax=Xanthomonas euvesicatoria TaxID=456327 RepID=UPI003558F955